MGMLTLGVVSAYAVPSNPDANLVLMSGAYQQVGTIKGTVLDAKTGEPIIGANVVVKGTTNGIITDFDGNYTLTAPVGSVLLISYIGYQPIEVKAAALLRLSSCRKIRKHWTRLW